MKKEWWSCPYDKKKLSKIDPEKKIEGVYILCPTCKREIEIINIPKPRGQNPEPQRSEVRTLELISSQLTM